MWCLDLANVGCVTTSDGRRQGCAGDRRSNARQARHCRGSGRGHGRGCSACEDRHAGPARSIHEVLAERGARNRARRSYDFWGRCRGAPRTGACLGRARDAKELAGRVVGRGFRNALGRGRDTHERGTRSRARERSTNASPPPPPLGASSRNSVIRRCRHVPRIDVELAPPLPFPAGANSEAARLERGRSHRRFCERQGDVAKSQRGGAPGRARGRAVGGIRVTRGARW